MFLTAYSPLARGGLMENDTLQEIARNHGKKPGQVILRWHMQQPDVVAIPKSTSDSHIEENLAVFDFELSDDEMDSIFALQAKNERQVDPDFAPEWDKAEPQKRAA